MTIIGITTTRHVPERESSMTYGGHPERLLTYTLICHTTRNKGNPDISNKARNYDTCTSAADTLISQVTPLLGITPRESTQLQSTNTQEDIEEILGTRAFQRYVDTPIQTLDGIVVNQPKHFLPLAQEARKIAEEIRIEKLMNSGLGYHENIF